MVTANKRCRAARLTLLGGTILLAAACTPDFQSQSQVTDLRILGIQAEPPESLVQGSCTDPTDLTTCTFTSADDMEISVLYLDPAHPTTPGVIMPTVCPPQTSDQPSNPICGPGSLALATQTGPQDTEKFSLFDSLAGDELELLPQLLIDSANASNLKGFGGVQVELQVGVDTGDPHGVQLGYKTLVFNLATADGNPNRNHNPAVTGMKLVDQQGNELGLLAPGDVLQLTVGVEIGLRPELADGSIETYQTLDLTGAVVTVRENLQWNFYTTAGADFDDETASEPDQGVSDPPEGLTRITASKATSGRIWAVVHDGRGGDAWIEIPWQATEDE